MLELELPHFAFEVVLTAIVTTLLIMIPTLLLYKVFVEPRFVRKERSGAVCCGCACLDLFLLNAEVSSFQNLVNSTAIGSADERESCAG